LYCYKFINEISETPINTIKGNTCPEGYEIFRDGECIDWTQEKRITPLQLETIPQPPEPEPYVPTLDELKQRKISEINSKRNQLEMAGFSYLDKIFDSDPISCQRITVAVQAAQAAISAGQTLSITWTCQDNSTITMDAIQIIGMSVTLAQHANTLHVHARELKNQINTATKVEDLGDITW
jgi:hypothetical protein